MSRSKWAMLFAVRSSKSRMVAANILLAISVTTAGEARDSDAYMQIDPIDHLNNLIGNGSGACAPGTTVQTDNGAVCGIVVNGINSWQGIPFAAPPVGDLRWAPPQPAAPWKLLSATAYRSQCLQTTGGDEDCLYLNVWAPPGADGLAVMAHIHGGGFRTGSGAGNYSLLSRAGNVVVVSLNYRLNIFGFAAHRGFGPNSGDYGLQDQQAALQWIQRNVSAFGGDPNNVTIFGESAGGSSVCDQIASPTAAGLFHKGISTSGQYNTIYETPESAGPLGTTLEVQDCKSRLPSLALAELIGDLFATELGCTGSDVAACMRAVDVGTVFNVSGLGYQYGGFGTIAPTINGTTLVASLPELLEDGNVNRVPVILGTNRDENLAGTANTPGDYASFIQAQFGKFAGLVTAMYPLNRFASPGIAWRTIAADAYTVCSELRTVRAFSRLMPTYQYLIEYAAPWPPAYTGVPSGAGHVRAWVLTPVLPSETLPNGLDNNQQVLQEEEIAHVSAFARTGDPTADGTPLWPEFSESAQVLSLNAGGSSQATSASEIGRIHNCAFWDALTPGK